MHDEQVPQKLQNATTKNISNCVIFRIGYVSDGNLYKNYQSTDFGLDASTIFNKASRLI